MELYFGNNIRRLRKAADITQDSFAQALGVTSQSVSKWECGYGFPDITLLPTIANYFGVSIDELFSNDENARDEIRREHEKEMNMLPFGDEKKIGITNRYIRKYPRDMYYRNWLCANIADCIVAHAELYDEYMPTLCDTVNTLLDTQYRHRAVGNMIRCCKDSELDKWLKLCAYNQNFTRRGMLIERYDFKGDMKLWSIHQALGRIENFAALLDGRYPDEFGPIKKAEFQRSILSVIASFGTDGKVPDGWLYLYAYKQLVLSACLFGSNKTDDAWVEFESAMEKFKRWYSLTDEYLELGGEMFAGLKLRRDAYCAADSDGNEYKFFGYDGLPRPDNGFLYSFLTNPRWAWFNSARSDVRFTSSVKWARTLIEDR